MENYNILSTRPRVALVGNQELTIQRLDTDYFDPANVGPIIAGEKKCPFPLRSLEEVSGRIECYGAYALTRFVEFVPMSPSTIPYIRIGDISGLTIDLDQCAQISQQVHERLPKSKCEPGMVLITVSGTIGKIAVVPSYYKEINSSQHTVKITCESSLNPNYVAAVLDSSFGQAQMRREAGGAVQKELYLYNVKTLRVPIPDRRIQNYIGAKVELAEHCRAEAFRLNAAIEDLMNDLFGRFKLPAIIHPSEDEKAFSAGIRELDPIRLDAKYYRPRFVSTTNALRIAGAQPFANLLIDSKYGASVPADYTDEGVPFIRGVDLSPNRISSESICYLDIKHENDLSRTRVRTGDVLITRSGTVGIAAAVDHKVDGFAFGSYMIRMRFKDAINPWFAAAFLNSSYGIIQVERLRNGAVQENINLEEIGRILIPVLDQKDQRLAAEMVSKRNSLLESSYQLLAEAKTNAEILIEGDLDVEGILSGRIRPPTREDIERELIQVNK